jgi:hypothetical protein
MSKFISLLAQAALICLCLYAIAKVAEWYIQWNLTP